MVEWCVNDPYSSDYRFGIKGIKVFVLLLCIMLIERDSCFTIYLLLLDSSYITT